MSKSICEKDTLIDLKGWNSILHEMMTRRIKIIPQIYVKHVNGRFFCWNIHQIYDNVHKRSACFLDHKNHRTIVLHFWTASSGLSLARAGTIASYIIVGLSDHTDSCRGGHDLFSFAERWWFAKWWWCGGRNEAMSGRIRHKSSRMTCAGDWPYISLSTCLVGRCPCLHYRKELFFRM